MRLGRVNEYTVMLGSQFSGFYAAKIMVCDSVKIGQRMSCTDFAREISQSTRRALN